MSDKDMKDHQKCVERFITLANNMKDEGLAIELVSDALMVASGLYTTYSIAGNEGGLESSGVDKVITRYRSNLERIQRVKEQEHKGS